MFDCVDKKSEVKENSYYYDYKILTSQNYGKAENEEPDNINNYELSDDGECPQYCKLCSENKKCLECKYDFILVRSENKETIKCKYYATIHIGNYKANDSFYYECMDNCDLCEEGNSCIACNLNSIYLYNKCIKKIDYCEEYNEDGTCKKCFINFGFIEGYRNECISVDRLEEYYTKDGGISYNQCEKDINHCFKCHFDLINDEVLCDQCYLSYVKNLNKCVKPINHCRAYDDDGLCSECDYGYGFIEDYRNECINSQELSEYYTTNYGKSYYMCDGKGSRHILNCTKCHYDTSLICDEYRSTTQQISECICDSKKINLNKYLVYLFVILIMF
jgi:hypothetical protein